MAHESEVRRHLLEKMLRDLVDRLIDHEDDLRAFVQNDPAVRADLARIVEQAKRLLVVE